MNKGRGKVNNIVFFIGALLVPYVYFMTVRPKLVRIENDLDNKLTSISDRELEKMKKKMTVIKEESKEEIISNKKI